MGKRIGLIDVDGHNFPNIPLMKARIKALGNSIAVPCAERVFIGILAAEREVQENG